MNFAKSADGTDIAWFDFGGSGPSLLLGHATGFCAQVWSPVVDILQDQFHCFAYDLRGHGSSGRPTPANRSWDWHRYAEDAAAVISAADLRKPFSVGHSCGAATALLLEQAQPSTFRALVGFEPVMFTDNPPKGPDQERDLAVGTRKRRRIFSSRDEALDKFATRGPFTKLHTKSLEAYVDHGFELQDDGTLVLRCDPEDEAQVYVMASAHDGFLNLGGVEPAVTVVRGAESTSFDEPTMRSVAENVQNGRFLQMNDVGHFGALERPAEFAKIVIDALTNDVSVRR